MTETCPICGAPLETDDTACPDCYWTRDEDPRERYDDDGREYADPRDYRDGLE